MLTGAPPEIFNRSQMQGAIYVVLDANWTTRVNLRKKGPSQEDSSVIFYIMCVNANTTRLPEEACNLDLRQFSVL